MVNGYVTLDLASKNIYKESLGAIKSGKPIMIVDTPDVYFADTIKATTIDGDLVVQITKGGKTITINDANAVSSEGEIKTPHLYEFYINAEDENETGYDLYVRMNCIIDLPLNETMNFTTDIYNKLNDLLFFDNVTAIDTLEKEFIVWFNGVYDIPTFTIEMKYIDFQNSNIASVNITLKTIRITQIQ